MITRHPGAIAKLPLKELNLDGNEEAGDAGCAAVFKAIPATLEKLAMSDTNIGHDASQILIQRLPNLSKLTEMITAFLHLCGVFWF